jgi:hypothetical protein
MLKRFILFLIIVLSCFSVFAYYHFREQGTLLTREVINEKWKQAKPEISLLKSGDLIFRHGRGAISKALMLFSRHEAKYSHAGIISMENNKAYVYHAIGGEENRSNKLRKDPIEVFCNPNDIYSFGIYRLDLDTNQLRKVDSLANNYYKHGLEFDTRFDIQSDDKMYCSEFVYKTIIQATGDKNYLPLSASSGISYVACDDLYLNVHCRNLYSYSY